MKAVWIRWKDARVAPGGWRDYGEAAEEELCTMETLGFVVHENRERIVIAQTIDVSLENYSNTTVVPKCWLVERFEIQ